MLLWLSLSTSVHSSRDFETELRELQSQLLAMGARCERVVGLAFEAFVQGDTGVTAEVEELDSRIDRDEIQIHSLILRILALRQPVADDLRFVTMALRLITDLERIGDEAVNITERIVREDGRAKSLVAEELAAMAGDARDMLHDALDAFVRLDTCSAERVLGADGPVDSAYASVIATMTGHMSTSEPEEILAGLRVIRVAKYLERIGDHATNVAEQVIFMISGEDVRHSKLRV